MGPSLQLPNVYLYLSTFFRQFMSQPPLTDVHGLFIGFRGYEVDTCGWHAMLRDSYSASSQCRLERMEFCKTKKGKLHEFLILHFSHHTHTSARAAVVVDRGLKHPSQSSAIVSPSLPRGTPARDRVHVVGQDVSLDAYLSSEHGEYHKLCSLEYPRSHDSDLSSSTPQPPSAIQLSILLLVITEHQPDYNLYEYNCYWFADMVFEASKRLFPGCQELCYKHDDRGQCRFNLPVLDRHSCRDICEEYGRNSSSLQMRKVEQDVADRQELQKKVEEGRRAYEEERRAHEEAERRCKQLQAELEAVTQAHLCTPVN